MTGPRHVANRIGSACRLVGAMLAPRAPFHSMSTAALAAFLEDRQRELRRRIDASEMLDLVRRGLAEFSVTRHAVAFTVDHGAEAGVELRYLYVPRGQRRRGAGRSLVARVRARYSQRPMFCLCLSQLEARSAQLVGFMPERQGDTWWQMTTCPGLDAQMAGRRPVAEAMLRQHMRSEP